MITPTIESIDCPKPPDSYELMLKESIEHFLVEFWKGGSHFSGFGSIFFRLVQTMTDPPLEVIWFYSAVTFHSSKSIFQDPSKKMLVAKDLFQLLVSCSSPCNGFKKVALLAPVVYELYNLVFEFSWEDLCLKRDIEDFLDGIVSYISICCSNISEEHDNGLDNLTACFVDLIRVWTVDRVGENCEFGDNLRVFFPLVSDDVRQAVGLGYEVNFLAGVVMSEAFLLRLCLKFGWGVSREELQKDMQNWAVQAIMGYRNCYFFDVLLRMLLEPSLPVPTLLSSEDEVLLRKVLYDAVILVNYSFLNCGRWTQQPGNHLKNLALTWLLVADNVIQFVRKNGDQTKAISYINAFSESHLPNQLIKWVTNQAGMEERTNRPNISTPKALIRWLIVLEAQGVRVFDNHISKLHAKVVIHKSGMECEHPEFKPDCTNPYENIFYVENKGQREDKVDEDQEMVDSVGDTFSAASCTVNSTATGGIRKRKEGMKDEGETRVKLIKYNFHETSVGQKFLPFSDDDVDGLSSGSEVDNPVHGSSTGSEVENAVSDEDMEGMGL
ncbi:hypothetical protein F0562_006959 [Nyssa sinensis]|uniref:Uncharacterized protein n=1 Tax=Nyssa sinensis TaxID=561372 RepID=A0A5J5A754_9ASTE|nr:hypothetical protein F0562_006959 [Nyssa sinensis]